MEINTDKPQLDTLRQECILISYVGFTTDFPNICIFFTRTRQ